MLKVVKRVQVNKDLIQFCIEDDKQPSKEFYAYTNGNGAFKSVAIINNDNNTRREYKSYRFTKKYFDVVCEWVKVERKKREFEQRKKVDELTYREVLDKVRNIIVYGVEENIEQAIRLSYGLDYFNGFEDEYNQYLNEENEEKKETLEKKLMRDVVDVYGVCLYPYYENLAKLECLASDSDETLNMYIKDMKRKGYKVDFYNMGYSFNNEYEYLIMVLVPIEKKSILQLVNMVIDEENTINDINEENYGTKLLDDLEKKLNDLFGEDETFKILDDVVCNTGIEKFDRLRIIDDMLTIKGIN